MSEDLRTHLNDLAHRFTYNEEDQERTLETLDNPTLFHRILGAVFFIYASFFGALSGCIYMLMKFSTDDDFKDMNVRYHYYGLGYYIGTAYFAVASRKYHYDFPLNLFLLLLAFSGIIALFILQMTRFDAVHLQFSDVPAVHFSFASFILLWVTSLFLHFPSSSYIGRLFRLLEVAAVAALAIYSYELYKYYRYVSIVLFGAGVVYALLRAEKLARLAQLDLYDHRVDLSSQQPVSNLRVWFHAIRISLQIVVWVLLVFSGLFTFSAFTLRPNSPWPTFGKTTTESEFD